MHLINKLRTKYVNNYEKQVLINASIRLTLLWVKYFFF